MGYDMDTIAPKRGQDALGHMQATAKFADIYDSPHANLFEFLTGERTLFIVNDRDRATPTARILEQIDQHLCEHGSSLLEMNPQFIIATGTHPPPAEEDQRFIFGSFFDQLMDRDAIWVHKAKDEEAHEQVHVTPRGTVVKADRRLADFSKVFAINSVEPHYFAGYTGGRKSILPGVCAFDTIEKNHSHAMDSHSRSLTLEGNPIHEDMVDAVKGIIAHFNLEVLAHHSVLIGSDLASVVVGDIFTGMESLLPEANRIFCAPIKGRYDIVWANAGAPLNRKLYQALKALENGKLAVRDGGILILEAPCELGLGPENFYNVMTSHPDPDVIIKGVRDNYTLSAHKTTNLLDFLKLGNSVYIVSGLDSELVQNMHCTPFTSMDDALDAALKQLGMETPRILKIIEANNVVPMVE